MRVLALIVLAGCWSASPPVATAPHEDLRNTTPASPRARAVLPPHSVWVGRYECAQGVSAIQLTIDVEPGGRAAAIFDFGPLADNPTVPAGAYRMIGRVIDNAAGFQLSLAPDRWLSQPDGYQMVGVEATSDRMRRKLRGKITNPRCSWIDVRRSD